MITWGALLLIHGLADGIWSQDGKSYPTSNVNILLIQATDLHLVQDHQNRLQNTHQPAPSLRSRLASCLESSLQGMSTPQPSNVSVEHTNGMNFDTSYMIFNQDNIALASPSWLPESHTVGN